MRHSILNIALAASCLFGLAGQAAMAAVDASQYVELKDAVPQVVPGKIEVVELFSYGCGHCYNLEASINPWAAQLPEDVNFVKLPAMFGGIWDVYGQLYLTLATLGAKPEAHHAVFEAIRGGNRLKTPEAMAELLEGQGIDPQKFLATYNSFAVQAKVMDAKKRTAAYQATGVPSLVVDGKYRFGMTNDGAKGLFAVADQLIAQVRAAK
ncbi:thiol:disulfide interchange protein DsbA/DsbL [Pseudomonas sp. SK3(2021)]|uniref:thiol:disulfide interchange protein DsbA/DsbL n=1 Tax=Pseudomonas sp. SK3(2021) TaxID=2841064 RepID=UPI00192A7BA7|nr:thiol:disulfide interchange protein DsbA/DsbL [Pseudomonas sp. SK3(2021)]QQZ39993.1 thiol:disulfide interchange protein DsbA/DsbL [Pseudomonas sp. SK3(2021)]